jgi:hypothetical protein
MERSIARRLPFAGLALLVTLFFLTACAGQELARREGITFPHSRLASFTELSPASAPYRAAFDDALHASGVPPTRVTRLPRVVKGSSYLVDPPYLGRTSYAQGVIFAWDGPEVPLREVLTHEMIHWVLFYGGEPALATNEAYVSRLADAAVRRREAERPDAGFYPGNLAEQDRWRELDARERAKDLRRRGVSRVDEPDPWSLAAGSITPQHP